MSGDTLADIRETEKNFSFDSEDVLGAISAMSGISSVTPAEDLEANGAIGLSAQDALAVKDLQSNTALQDIIEKWKARYHSYTEKMELDKTKADERLSLLARSIELKLVLADLAELFEDAAEYSPTTAEKMLGAKSTNKIAPSVGEILEPDLPAVTTQEAKDENAQRAALFIRNAEKADQFFRDNPIKKE